MIFQVFHKCEFFMNSFFYFFSNSEAHFSSTAKSLGGKFENKICLKKKNDQKLELKLSMYFEKLFGSTHQKCS